MRRRNLVEQKYNVFRCIGCGVCKGGYLPKVSPCPLWLSCSGFEHESPRGIVTIAKDILQGEFSYSEELANLLFRCPVCGNCRALCGSVNEETGEPLIDASKFVVAMRADMVEEGLAPSKVGDFLQNVHEHGNPWGEPRRRRGEWAENAGIRQYKQGDEFLYYVGCVGSYDVRAQQVARALGNLLVEAALPFGILGNEEDCDGNEVNKLGETGLFQILAEGNIQKLKELGVRKIVTLSPHAYNTIKNDYPRFGADFEVVHYTQLLRDILKSGKMNLKLSARITYHDPCFLGRHNNEYEAPREVLTSISGVELKEMERNRENSLCCGGGAGNFYTDLLDGAENAPARMRVREACDTGAEILAVACPVCMIMFEDALRVEMLKEKLAIKDIAEIVREASQERSG